MALRLRRGTEAERTANNFTPALGEPIYITDSKTLYIGDGSTVGGVKVGTNLKLEDIEDISLPTAQPISTSLVAVVGGIVLITTAGIHGFFTGDSVKIALEDQSQLNGTFTITVTSSTSFTYPLAGANDLSQRIVSGLVTKQIKNESILGYDAVSDKWINQEYVYTLATLGDVALSDLQNNNLLKYNSSISKWQNGTVSLGIDDLTDVSVTGTAEDGQILTYDTELEQWVNRTYDFSIDDISDVEISDPEEGQLLTYDGSKWINQALSISSVDLDSLADVTISSPQDGQLLKYDEGNWINVNFGASLSDFSDVEFTDLQDNNFISFSQGKFINKFINLDDLGDVSGTTGSVADRAVLAYNSSTGNWVPQQIQSLSSRQNVVISTGPILNNASVAVDFTAFTGYAILTAQASAISILTLYAAAEDRTADEGRNPSLIVPPINNGIFAELKFNDVSVNRLGPVLLGYNDDETISRNGYARVKNTSGSDQSDITITLTVIQVENDPA